MTKRRSDGPAAKLARLNTEMRNPASAVLDTLSPLAIARLINKEDSTVAASVAKAMPQIARAIEVVALALSAGGRLIYVGAGTSGRIAALDASECPPTFGVDPQKVQFVIAGGARALANAAEDAEDSAESGRRDLQARKPGPRDIVIALAASGRTPYTVAALKYASTKGAKTCAITCNPGSPLERAADIAIVIPVGPEVVAGSTRMKAGTAQKMVCNMITTGAMARLGYIYGDLMVNVHLNNEKLLERGIRILQSAAQVGRQPALRALREAGGSVPTALVMLKARVPRKEAEQRLKLSNGHIRQAIENPLARETRN